MFGPGDASAFRLAANAAAFLHRAAGRADVAGEADRMAAAIDVTDEGERPSLLASAPAVEHSYTSPSPSLMEQLLAPAMLDAAVEASLGRTIRVDVTRPIVVPCDRVPGPPGTPEHVARLLDLALALAAAAPHFAHRPALCGRIATEAHAVFTAARRYATPDDWSNSGEIEEAWARMLFETSVRLEPHERAWVLDLVTLAATVTDDAPTRCGGNQRLRSLGREVRERLIAWQTDAGNRHAVDALRADSGRFW